MARKVVLVGCGNMGFAMLRGWLDSGALDPHEVSVVEPGEALRARAQGLGVEAVAEPSALSGGDAPSLVVLAVKPQLILDVARAYRDMATAGTTFLSVAAGTSIGALHGVLGEATPVMRCMPNTPAAIGQGMMVTVDDGKVGKEMLDFVDRLLGASGKTAQVPDEAMMDAVTAVSGSGPAYVFHFIECLRDAGIAAGLPDATARLLALQTVLGAATLAASSKDEPDELRRQVTSPNGTTAAALDVLMSEDGLKPLLTRAVEAARRSSVELGA